jgi:calcineurin-like phosphoesterase family protein
MMSKIFICSDLHFNHDRQFVWGARGFNSVEEMNEAIIERHNNVVNPEDDVYICGDLCLGGGVEGITARNQALIERLNGHIHIVLGNHDTPARIEMYRFCKNVVEVCYATMIHYNGYHFFLSHYPCMTANLEKESLKQCTINLFGHTHQTKNFYNDIPFMYHVGMDSHNCTPVLLDDAIEEMKNKVQECKEQL